jgi:hypothetical protein
MPIPRAGLYSQSAVHPSSRLRLRQFPTISGAIVDRTKCKFGYRSKPLLGPTELLPGSGGALGPVIPSSEFFTNCPCSDPKCGLTGGTHDADGPRGLVVCWTSASLHRSRTSETIRRNAAISRGFGWQQKAAPCRPVIAAGAKHASNRAVGFGSLSSSDGKNRMTAQSGYC